MGMENYIINNKRKSLEIKSGQKAMKLGGNLIIQETGILDFKYKKVPVEIEKLKFEYSLCFFRILTNYSNEGWKMFLQKFKTKGRDTLLHDTILLIY